MSAPIPIVWNPTAGGGRLVRHRRRLDAVANEVGAELDWWQTERPGHATELAARARERALPLLLAFGGDGTYNEVARGLLGGSTALGILPGGTTSVLAYELGVPRPATAALPALLAGVDRAMRVGVTDRDDVFLIMLSAGPDSAVLDCLPPALKQRGKLGIAVHAFGQALTMPLPLVRAIVAGEPVDGGWAIVGNCRCYGGPFHATPGADPFADELELVVQRRRGRRAAIPFVLSIPFRRHVRRRDVERSRASSIRLEPANAGDRVPYQVDGDCAGVLPVEISLHPDRLPIRLPAPSTETR